MSKQADKPDHMDKAPHAPEPSTEMTTISQRALASVGPVIVGGMEFKSKGKVTIPTLSHKFPDTLAVAVMFETPFVANITKNEDDKEQIVYVARVIDLTTGEVCRYVGGAIVVKELSALEHSYVGRKFAIAKLKPKEGKRYNQIEIQEIE